MLPFPNAILHSGHEVSPQHFAPALPFSEWAAFENDGCRIAALTDDFAGLEAATELLQGSKK
jgi:hypothetical protein